VTRRSLSGAGAILALALTLLLPAVVRGEEEQMPPTGFRLQASNGFELLVEAGSPGVSEDGWIALFLLRGHSAIVTYAAPATVSPSRIDADLGTLGRISVKRVPTGRTETVRDCEKGGRKQVAAARYEGTIEFHGEEEFTEVTAARAPIVVPPNCGVIPEGGRPPGKALPGARLSAEKRIAETYRADFDAIQRRPGTRIAISAEVEEHRGEIEIHRAVGLWTSPGTLSYDRRLRTATVRPPAPFAGYGRFQGNAGHAGRWAGNLTVDLPGRSDVPVAGRGFRASLEHPRR
jgi:hypothetical protein